MKRNTRQLHALPSNLATNEKKLLCEAVIKTKKSYIVIGKRRSKFDTENGISRASAKYALDCVGNRFQLNLRLGAHTIAILGKTSKTLYRLLKDIGNIPKLFNEKNMILVNLHTERCTKLKISG